MFRKFSFYISAAAAIIAAACTPDFAHAQIINPNPPSVAASAIAGTGLSQAGAVISVNYGVAAGTSMQGNTSAVPAWHTTNAITSSTNVGPLGMGTLTWSDTNIFGSWQTSANSFAQMVLQNSSNGATASTSYLVSNDVGTATTFYGEFGINSSGFTGTGSLNLPSATYLTATSGDLVLGTTTGNAFRVVVNGATSDNLAINGSGVLSGTSLANYEAALNHVQTVLNVAALRVTNCAAGLIYKTQGYYTVADQGDGIYVCDGTDTTSADNGGTVIAANNTFRFKLQYNGRFTTRQFGAKGDNTTDDTTTIQNFLVAVRIQSGLGVEGKWVKGTYKLTATETIGSQLYVTFDPSVVINFVPADPANTTLFTIAGQTDVTFIGNGATINGSQTTVSSTGSGIAFFIYGCDRVRIVGFNINTMATDGVTVTGDNTGSGPARNVILENLIVKGSARNGLSIISARNLLVLGGQFSGSTGSTSGPWAGIDIEPNPDSFSENINLVGVSTSGNQGAGIQITPSAMNNGANRMTVNITGGRSLNDGGLVATPTISKPAFLLANGGQPANIVYGQINVRGFAIDSPQGAGFGLQNWDGAFMPKVLIESMSVINPDYTLNAPTNIGRVGYLLYTSTAMAVTSQGNIVIKDSTAQDTRGTARMVAGFYATVDTGKNLSNIQILNPTSINYTASEKADVNTGFNTVAGGGTNFDVQYDIPSPTSVSGSASMGDYIGKRVVASSTLNFTLPLAANVPGSHQEFKAAPGVAGVSVIPSTGDTIQWYGFAASAAMVLDNGGYISLRSDGGTSWTVETISGRVRRAGTNAQGSIQFASTQPSNGSNGSAGDITFNIAPAIGQPRGWQCTAGTTTCTTWISMGNN